jgi:hypothetical protein
VPGGNVTVKIARTDVSGSVGGDGQVKMNVPYDATISAFGLNCTVKGSAALTSSSTDANGGGTGKNYDATTGAFAVAGTSAPPATSGALCAPGRRHPRPEPRDRLVLRRHADHNTGGTEPAAAVRRCQAAEPGETKGPHGAGGRSPGHQRRSAGIGQRHVGHDEVGQGQQEGVCPVVHQGREGRSAYHRQGEEAPCPPHAAGPGQPGYEAFRTTRAWKTR